jgi:hypothetical protein
MTLAALQRGAVFDKLNGGFTRRADENLEKFRVDGHIAQ